MALSHLLREGLPVRGHGPWPRALLDPARWSDAVTQLAGRRLTLLGLWGEAPAGAEGDAAAVHMALLEEAAGTVGVVSLACPGGHFPSVARSHPPALRLERTLHDLFGLEPRGTPDARPWLDHGRWPGRFPLAGRALDDPDPRDGGTPEPYRFLPVEGDGLHEVAVGPVHAGIIEPGHFRFTASGETVVRLEQRFGWAHKGIEGLMAGAGLAQAARLAGRTSGDSTAAYALAFARAVEAALGLEPPPRAVWLRALLAELERLANHLGDVGAICNDAALAILHAHCGVLREQVLRANEAAFGHRLLRDRIRPGGVAVELTAEGAVAIQAVTAEIARRLPRLVRLYENSASLQDRTVGTGILVPALARQYGAGGYVGRASGRAFDTRRALPYAPYDQLDFEVPLLEEGDVNARVWIRIREIEQSLSLVEQILRRLPDGALATELPAAGEAREGLALVEGFRGDILVWLRLAGDGRVERCHLRDPSWFQWPLLEAAAEGNIVADFPLCNKSFNCSYSGVDL